MRTYTIVLAAAMLLGGCQRSDKITCIDGSCEQAKAIGNLADYTTRLRAQKSNLGFIRVRSDANWNAQDASNVLGTVRSGTFLWACGPLKNSEDPNGIGYAVAIRDKTGRTGRGYVSLSVIDEIHSK